MKKYVIKFETRSPGNIKWKGYVTRIVKATGEFSMNLWSSGMAGFSEKVADDKISLLESFERNKDIKFTKEQVSQ